MSPAPTCAAAPVGTSDASALDNRGRRPGQPSKERVIRGGGRRKAPRRRREGEADATAAGRGVVPRPVWDRRGACCARSPSPACLACAPLVPRTPTMLRALVPAAAALLSVAHAPSQAIIAQLSGLPAAAQAIDFGTGQFPNWTPVTTQFPGISVTHAAYYTTGTHLNLVGGFLTNDLDRKS